MYAKNLEESLSSSGVEERSSYSFGFFGKGFRTIIVFWIIGMSVVGTPFLALYIGYKGFSLGYTISTVIKVLGTLEGNKYVFQNLFFNNTILVFIMIFMANYSIKMFKNFFEDRENIKVDAIKYSVISALTCTFYVVVCMIQKIIF